MSYLDQTQDFRRRAAAAAGVAVIHTAIGLGLVVGLTVSGVIPQKDGWDPFTLTPDPLPKPPPPPKAEDATQAQESFVTAPTPPIDILIDRPVDAVVVDETVDRPVAFIPVPPLEKGTPAPPATPAFKPSKAVPANDPRSWLSTDDYPARALRSEAEGVAAYRLIVGTNGRVSACEVTRSTGNGLLDDATCKFIVRRARFEPATDEAGAKVVGDYTGTVKWEIPD